MRWVRCLLVDELMGAPCQPTSHERVRAALKGVPLGTFLSALVSASGKEPIPDRGDVPSASCLEMMLASLELAGSERVLEVGSTSGYETALLSRLAHDVVSLEPDAEVAGARLRALLALGCENVRLFLGHGPAGWPSEAPYQAILVAGAVPRLPLALIDQLAVGGRLVAPLGDASGQLVEIVHKRVDGITTGVLGPSRLPVLPWATGRPSFLPWNREGTRY